MVLVLCCLGLSAQAQWPEADSVKSKLYVKEGVASYYANKLHGNRTTSGERYHKNRLTAAHRTLPFGTLVKVTNLKNKRWVIVRINDRGPFNRKRIIDLSYRAAKHLGLVNGKGLARVRIEEIPKPKPTPPPENKTGE
jgi:rare lipoprotein A